ncbi:GyrI-like domain-containing protein [Hymenobacter rubripertinctus]|uniref:AraC family transcriptional regulator n=1 Tax=Hymenobacter rubripertinctus TaxID=2029981 RepID=A0A418R968_9BACT|nr:GyrI-like domain-containing protein [Hymenobacter rubripertinctus]RIY13835.1 AraC family transcriptional regulator [Hymenobacter rubripertinctus]
MSAFPTLQPRLFDAPARHLVGQCLVMSREHDRTPELWRAFMPRRREMEPPVGPDLFSVTQYPPAYFAAYSPRTQFCKWAALEVPAATPVPPNMQALVVPAGRYAIFDYRGSSLDPRIFQAILTQWLPTSGWLLDSTRPHLEVLGPGYRNAHPSSEEEIWLPVAACAG